MTKEEAQKKQEKLAKLIDLESSILASYYADSIRRGSEEFAPVYRKNPKIFKQLLRSELKTNVAMKRYFRELAERVIEDLNWSVFERQTKASYTAASILENETLVLKVYLTKALVDALEAGGLYSEEELKIDVGWSRESPPAIEFLNKYSLDLAKGLTDTTKKSILTALKTSIDNGENRDGAVERLNKIIKNPVRATTIAQTESVRAFSAGRMEVGRQVGANRKSWRTAGDKKVSIICRTNELLGVVPFNYKYNDFQGEKVTEPPAHPNCRSGIILYMPGEKV